MDKLFIITKMILKRMLKKPTGILLHLVMPVAASVGLFLLVSLNTGSTIAIGISDLDSSATSSAFISALEKTSGIGVYPINVGDIDAVVARRELVASIIIPQDFETTILDGKTPTVKIIALNESKNSEWIGSLVEQEAISFMAVAESVNYDIIDYKLKLKTLDIGYQLIKTSVVDQSVEKNGFVQTIGVYMLLLMISTFMIAFKILDEKRMGTYNRIGLTSVHPKIYTFANILSGIIMMMIQVSLVLLILKLSGVTFYTSFTSLFIVLMSFAICGISLAVMVAAFSRSSNEANATIGLILSPSCMLAGCLWPLEYMPEVLQKAAYLMPQRWTLDAIKLLQREGTLVTIIPNLLVVLGFTSLFFLLTVYKINNEDRAIN